MKFDQEEVEPGPWDRVDSFSLAKEAKWFEDERVRREAEEASRTAQDASIGASGTRCHNHNQNAPQGSPDAKESQS
jgi:hypothetical protein